MAIGYALGCSAGVQFAALPFAGRVNPTQWRQQQRQRGRGMTVYMSVQKTSAKVVQAEKLLREFRQASATPLPLLHQVSDALVHEMNMGLASEGGSDQLKMLPTYVENLPSGYCDPSPSPPPFKSLPSTRSAFSRYIYSRFHPPVCHRKHKLGAEVSNDYSWAFASSGCSSCRRFESREFWKFAYLLELLLVLF